MADGRFHLLPGGAIDLGAATAVDVHVDEPGDDQHVPQVDHGRPGRRQPATDVADGPSLDDDEAVLEDDVRGGHPSGGEGVVRHTVV